LFQASTVAICPIRDGGGTRIKILDALAQGMPIVSTSIGCEGIAVTPKQDALIADSPTTFATAIGRVFDDADLRGRLAVHARRLAERLYSWEALAKQLSTHYHEVTRSHQPMRALERVASQS